MEYLVCGKLVEFHFGGPRDGFHFAFDATALRKLATLSTAALARLNASSAGTCVSSATELTANQKEESVA